MKVVSLFIANDLKYIRSSQIYQNTQIVLVLGFLKQITSVSYTINMQRDPEYIVELILHKDVSNLSNIPKLCDVFVETLIRFYVESKQSSGNPH